MPNLKESMLTQNKVKELLDYRPKTGDLIWRVECGKNKMTGKIAGCLCKHHGYCNIKIDGKLYRAHRLIWLYVYGAWPIGDIDHVNGVRHDNRLSNLREATRSQNAQNQRKPRVTNTSSYLGVSAHKGKWMAQIQVNGKKHYIGCYSTPEAAHVAYLVKKRELHPFGTL